MLFEDVIATVLRWSTATEALAALGAELSVRQPGVDAPPEILAALNEVSSTAGITDLAELPAQQRAMLIGIIRMQLHLATDLLEQPHRPPGWTFTDPVIVDGMGRPSAMLPPLIASSHPDLANVTTFLDVGTGVGLLAIAAAGVWPSATIVGIDPWEPSLERARGNVAESGLENRITLRQQELADLADVDTFDCVWIPTFFLTEAALEKALPAAMRALRPGGWIVLGRNRTAPDPLAEATATLRWLRAGGCSLDAGRAVELLEEAGCAAVHPAQLPGGVPIELVLGQHPTA